MNAGDVRMVEGGEDARLALEAREPLGLGRVRQELERDRASEPGIERAIHDAHAAGTDLGFDPIGSEAVSGGDHGR